MESLSETQWDVVIEGTDLRQSLLALALSRSGKKVLHVDQNEYYGGAEAAFSLQELDEWVEKAKGDHTTGLFRNASLWRADAEDSTGATALSFSRAYSLTLSPQIIYTKSKLLSQLISSKVYRQLEFQAVGNWWIYTVPDAGHEPAQTAILKRLPNGREDIFDDAGIENRSKRSLMKFLKFVLDYQSHPEVWESHATDGLPGFLASKFQLSPHLQAVIGALTLSLDLPEETSVGYALPRIARHLTSIGVFGPGFGAVVPKWGGGAEIAQVACRAGAVGGGVYVLGTGISTSEQGGGDQPIDIHLSNGETVKTKYLARRSEPANTDQRATIAISKIIGVASSPLHSLFQTSIDGSPLPAVSVIVFPPNTLTTETLAHTHPVYIMAHSSDAGECPAGQCVLYATTIYSSSSKVLLEAALDAFLATPSGDAKLLYRLYYEQQQGIRSTEGPFKGMETSMDLAFNDLVLDDVAAEWKLIMGDEADEAAFMQFDERPGMNEEEEDH